MTARRRRALVVGGGIGGLTAAIALRRAGLDVTVFERAPELRPVGGGLTLWSNAMLALARLGVADAVRGRSVPVERGETRNQAGRLLSTIAVGDVGRRAGAPSIALHRGDLQQALLSALPADVVLLGCDGASFREHDDGVTLHLADGREERGDLLVGADGLRSAIRAQLLGPAPLRYSGCVGWQAVAAVDPAACPAGLWRLWVGRGAQFGVVPIRPGRAYWFGTCNAAAGALTGRDGLRVRVRDRFAGWPAPILSVIEGTDETAIIPNDLYDREPTGPWGEGRMTLLGDAAHPMTPNLGQGACQAIEDAVVLADCLRRDADASRALRAYEARRRTRAVSIVRKAWRFGRIVHAESRTFCRLRDWGWRLTPTWFETARLARLLEGDAATVD